MSYLSLQFCFFTLLVMIAFYTPSLIVKNNKLLLCIQQSVLLAGSIVFYFLICPGGILIFLLTIVISYGFGAGLSFLGKRLSRSRLFICILIISIIVVASPLLLVKLYPWLVRIRGANSIHWIIPVGLSFYTLQIISYLSDCYTGKVEPEKNILKYALFVSYFPHIVQGPIPRFSSLSKELNTCHRFNTKKVVNGIQLIIWGCFLKMMIADKVAYSVNLIFDNPDQYAGTYIIVSAILYSIQLYTDFYACTTICQGVSALFGIRISDNFKRPYFALSIKDFWRRWHISLSSWFRDYIYIPLGGGRNGIFRTYCNVFIIFFVSGLWHGDGYTFIAWGLLHGLYQIVGKMSYRFRESIYRKLKIGKETFAYRSLKRIGSFLWVTLAWVFFRANSLKTALQIIRNAFVCYNPWIILGTDRYSFGLDIHDCIILSIALLILIAVSIYQEKGICLREIVNRQHIIVRWAIYIIAISSIWIFGTYGYGFNAIDFIYGGF